MPDLRISQLPVASTPLAGTELVPIVQGGITEQTTVQAIMTSTVPSGTANGVLYLNGSKVATSGTALAFNGTSLLVGKNSSDANNWGVQNYATNAFGSGMQLTYGGVGSAGLWVPAASSLAFGADAGSGTTELMRLTSTGLGIGTSSPGAKLGVGGNAIFSGGVGGSPFIAFSQDQAGGTPAYWQWSSSTGLSTFYTTNASSSNGSFKWMTGGSDKMFLDSSGNLGLGVTPSTWSLGKAFQVNSLDGAVVWGYAGAAQFGNNFYFNGGYLYATTAAATRYVQSGGAHQWFTAPSGTAGNAISFTQAMTLDASGNLTFGQTSSALQSGGTGITLYGSSASELKFLNSTTGQLATDGTALVTSGSDFVINNREAGAITFGTSNTERARITSAGDLITNVNGTAPSLSTNSTMSFELTSNTSLKIVVRGTDGVTRSVSLTLA